MTLHYKSLRYTTQIESDRKSCEEKQSMYRTKCKAMGTKATTIRHTELGRRHWLREQLTSSINFGGFVDRLGLIILSCRQRLKPLGSIDGVDDLLVWP